MNNIKYITLVDFIAFNRPMRELFVDTELIMMYNLKRRIKQICHTAIITKIEYYEGTLVNTEIFKHNIEVNPIVEQMKNEYK